MPNIATVLKVEISRLARKEIRREVGPLRKTAAGYRREIAQLKRTLASLDRRMKQIGKARPSNDVTVEQERPIRFVAKGLISLRKRLGLSAVELARLLSVSMQSIYNWEHKKATPRKEQIAAIASLRAIGKKEVRERLSEKGQGKTRPSLARRISRKRASQRQRAKAKPSQRKAASAR
jgi:DNA-binding transcriptional regulator YiaG